MTSHHLFGATQGVCVKSALLQELRVLRGEQAVDDAIVFREEYFLWVLGAARGDPDLRAHMASDGKSIVTQIQLPSVFHQGLLSQLMTNFLFRIPQEQRILRGEQAVDEATRGSQSHRMSCLPQIRYYEFCRSSASCGASRRWTSPRRTLRTIRTGGRAARARRARRGVAPRRGRPPAGSPRAEALRSQR
jgi:hypothetical protein